MSYTTRATNARQHAEDRYGRRQPRPAMRRTGTRSAVIALAIREG